MLSGLFVCSITFFGPTSIFAQNAGSDEDDSVEDPFAVTDDGESGASSEDAFGDPFGDPFVVSDEEDPSGDSEDAFGGPFGDPFDVSDEEDPSGDSEDPFGDLDSLFQGDMIEVPEPTDDEAAPEKDLLVDAGISWGGRVSGSVSSEWNWDNIGTESFDPLDAGTESLSPSVSADLFFDARPDADFRAFGKLKIVSDTSGGADLTGTVNDIALTGDLPAGWSREEEDNGDTTIRDQNGDVVFTVADSEESSEPATGTAPALSLSVFELFSDFNFQELLFFRFGKHTIKWGVGYFWSPADVVNLSAIDTEDPTADREGPLSLKAQLPFDIHNAYLYAITNIDAKPLEIAIAPRVEFVIGSTEFGLAAYYQQALAPRGIITALSSIGDIDFFGEAVLSLGSDRVFIRQSRKEVEDFEDPPEELTTVLDTFTVDGYPFFSSTLGFRYLEELEEKAGNLALIGQYFFNGEGYEDSTLLEPAYFLLQNTAYNGLIIADANAQSQGYEDPPALAISDLLNFGRHYGAITVSWNDIFDSGLGFSIFALANLTDLSGIITPALSFDVLDVFNVGISARITFGDEGDEYTNIASLLGNSENEDLGSTLALSLSVSLGGGSF